MDTVGNPNYQRWSGATHARRGTGRSMRITATPPSVAATVVNRVCSGRTEVGLNQCQGGLAFSVSRSVYKKSLPVQSLVAMSGR
eukprot:4696706-Prorocentrum_lima.AAC.1